jgi:signal peptidase I
MKIPVKKILKHLWFGFRLLCYTILLTVFFKVFCIASFKIPSYSMLPALTEGDFVMVNKLAMGARVYRSLRVEAGKRAETFRMPGFSRVKRNDVLVFNRPFGSNSREMELAPDVFFIKRCVAVPGDTLSIQNGFYRLRNSTDSVGNCRNQERLSHTADSNFPKDVFRCFPKDSPYHYWTMKNFGELYVPRRGDRLRLDSVNIYLYRKIIEYETQEKTSIIGGAVMLNGKRLESYCFGTNYYFMAGDNVFDSQDSRYWGLLPEEFIVGKAVIIWKSVDKNGRINWERFLKTMGKE